MLLQSLAIPVILYSSVVVARPAPKLESRQTTASTDCPTTGIHVIAASGANLAEDDYGLLGNLSTSIINAIPGSTTVQVPYPKTGDLLAGTTAGSVNFTNYLDEFHASCPCSKVAIIGYSAGADLTMNALCGAYLPWTSPVGGFNSSYADFIIGIIEYGDETHTASAPYNMGTCTGNGRFPRSDANAACPIFADRIQAYCDVADPQCCLGTNNTAHFAYDMEYDAASTQYIVDKANAFGDVCPVSVSSTSSVVVATSSPMTSSTSTLMTSSTELSQTTTSTQISTTTSDASSTCSCPSTTSSTSTSEATPTPTSTSTTSDIRTTTSTSTTMSTSTTSTTSTTTPTASASTCPLDLASTWQYPHLIVPISSTSPSTSYGTSYNGQVNSTVSTIFNFDVPASYAGMTCTLFFNLPLLSDLLYSSYTTSGGPGVSFALLNGIADAGTTFDSAPAVETGYGDFDVVPGTPVALATAPCAADLTVSYEMGATGDYALEYFQEAAEPVGLYMRAC